MRDRSSELASILDAVLESAVDRSRWPVALERITKATDAIGANFLGCSFNQPDHGFLVTSGFDEDFGYLFLERYQDNPLARSVLVAGAGSAVDQTSLLNSRMLRRTAFHTDILVPQGIRGHIAIGLRLSDQTDTGGVSVSLNSTNARQARHVVEVLNAIGPVLQHAASAAIRLPLSDLPVATVLEALPTAVMIVDATGCVTFMNAKAQALTRAGEGFDVRRRQLIVHDRSDHSALMRLISAATATNLKCAASSSVCRVHRPNQKAPLIVHVYAMRDAHDQFALSRVSHAIVFLSRPEDDAQHSSASESRLRALFNMTRAEARVALSIAKGKNIPEVAKRLGVSEGTIHTHLHRVFEKTGIRRQSSLARMLTRTGILDLP